MWNSLWGNTGEPLNLLDHRLLSIWFQKRNIHTYKYITYYKFYLAEGQLVTQAGPLVPGDPVDLHHKGELLLVKILNHQDEVLLSMTRY